MKAVCCSLLSGLLWLSAGCQFMEPGLPGSGNVTEESRELEPFHAVSFAGGGSLEIQVGTEPQECLIECDDNLMEFIETKVVNGKLQIKATRNIAPTAEIAVKLSMQRLENVSTAGSCKTQITGLNEEKLKLSIAGSGEIRCSGTVHSLTISVAGSGDVQATDLMAREVDVSIAGSGNARVHAEEKLKVDVAGSGDVQYLGQASVHQRIAGSGSVEKIEE